jgi:LacI family transcriptional regulator
LSAVSRRIRPGKNVLRDITFLLNFDGCFLPPRTVCGGYRSTASLLELENPPTAAVCFNDLVAFGLVQGLQQAGRKPGAEFGIIGFNDVSLVVNSWPHLTTVDTPPRQLGEVAAELLLRWIAKP